MERWWYSTNHKDIGTLYFIIGVLGGIMGMSMSAVMRLELVSSGEVLGLPLIFNSMTTLHAFLMIFFFIMPVMVGGFGNWLMPLMINSSDMIFPRLNNMSFWVLPFSMFFLVLSGFLGEGVSTGWTL